MSQVLHLGYHYVLDGNAPGANCPPDRLRDQLAYFKENGWTILTCGDVAWHIKEKLPLPEKCVTLSFDDGLKSQYAAALPILCEFDAPATFFVITCPLEGAMPPVIGFQILIDQLGAERIEKEILPDLLKETWYRVLFGLDPNHYGAKKGEPPEMRLIKWIFNHFLPQSFKMDLISEMFARYIGQNAERSMVRRWFLTDTELREMDREGMEIASHSHTHPDFAACGLTEIETEMIRSKEALKNVLPRTTIETFGWPFGGAYRQSVINLAARHYASAWNFMSARSMPAEYNPHNIPRLHEGWGFPPS